MILTTTNSVEGFKILEYKGIVSGTAVNSPKMSLTFNVQKYYDGISESVLEIKEKAIEVLKINAEKLNANAIVGIKIDVEVTASNYVVVHATGTAVGIIKK